jgi:hypothetical protein
VSGLGIGVQDRRGGNANVLAAVRKLVDAAAEESTPIELPRVWVSQLLDAAVHHDEPILGPEPELGYSLVDLAKACGRNRSTVLSWIRGGQLPGAYLFMNREWRVPLKSWGAFMAAQRGTAVEVPKEKQPPLGRWRMKDR